MPASRLQQVAPPLRDAVLKSQPGAISQVSAGGAHTLVLLVEKEPAGQRDLSTAGVKESITNALKERRSQLRRSAYVANLRNDAKVINYLARQLAPAPKPQAVTPAAPGRQ